MPLIACGRRWRLRLSFDDFSNEKGSEPIKFDFAGGNKRRTPQDKGCAGIRVPPHPTECLEAAVLGFVTPPPRPAPSTMVKKPGAPPGFPEGEKKT